jgi:hypothetical protein
MLMVGPDLTEHHGKVFKQAVPDRHNPLQKFPSDREGQVRAWALDRARNIRSMDYPGRDREGNVVWGLQMTEAHYEFDKIGDIYSARLKMKMETTREQPTDEELGTAASDDDNQADRDDDLPGLVSPSTASDNDADEQPGPMMADLRNAVEDMEAEHQIERQNETQQMDHLREARNNDDQAAGQGGLVVETQRQGERARFVLGHDWLDHVNVHLREENNELRNEADVLAAVRRSLVAHVGVVDVRIAELEQQGDHGLAAGGDADQPGPAAADGEAGQPGPAAGAGGDVIMGDDIPGDVQN